MNRPIFSIILPTFQRKSLFTRALASIEQQTFDSYEVIIIDDGSEIPYVRDICKKTKMHYKIINNEKSLGAGGARNEGIKIAQGRYITFLDDDDEYHPDFLQVTYDRLESTPASIGLAWCGAYCLDYQDETNTSFTVRERTFDSTCKSDIILLEQLMSIGTGMGVTIKNACIKKAGMFNPTLRTTEDAELFLRVLAAGYFPAIIPGIHITIHNHRMPRLSSVDMHATRIKECRDLLIAYAPFLSRRPLLRVQILNYIDFLKKELLEHNKK